MGRSFFSPGDSGIYMSLLLKPEIKPEDAVQITTAAAVSVCKALACLGVTDAKMLIYMYSIEVGIGLGISVYYFIEFIE